MNVVDNDDDPFEAEMLAELERRAGNKRREAGLPQQMLDQAKEPAEEVNNPDQTATAEQGSKKSDANDARKGRNCYDDIYFDSDEEEGAPKINRRRKVADDDLLYDPNMDDEDQEYVDNLRRQYHESLPSGSGSSHLGQARAAAKQASATKPLPNSDAVLNCPACFNVVCLDCQRHAVYKNQYRAMFVLNCIVDRSRKLKVPLQEERKKRGKRGKKRNEPEANTKLENKDSEESDTFHPVKCEQCTTEIGVFDKDEVYHFFNIMASYS